MQNELIRSLEDNTASPHKTEAVESGCLKSVVNWGAFYVFACISFFVLQSIVDTPFAQKAQALLEAELTELLPLPHATLLENNTKRATFSVIIERKYWIVQEFETLRPLYAETLAEHGWHVYLPHPNNYYVKGKFCAEFQAIDTNKFLFQLRWGERQCPISGQRVSGGLFLVGFSLIIIVQGMRQAWITRMKTANRRIELVLFVIGGMAVAVVLFLVGAASLWENIVWFNSS